MNWEYIDTAPKDGTPVIGWFGNASQPYAESVYWAAFVEDGKDYGVWVWQHDGDSPQIAPTHWMTLNPPDAKLARATAPHEEAQTF